jgi:hypothetical protein
MKRIYLKIAILSAFVFSGCETDYQEKFKQECPFLKRPATVKVDAVNGIEMPEEKNLNTLFKLRESGYLLIGRAMICEDHILNQKELKKLTSQVGGDFFLNYYNEGNTIHSSRLELTSYTPSQFVASSSQSSGNANYQNSYSDNTGYSAIDSGNVNASAYGTSQTMVGASSTYSRVPYDFTVIDNYIIIFLSSQRAKKLVREGLLSQEMVDYYSYSKFLERAAKK